MLCQNSDCLNSWCGCVNKVFDVSICTEPMATITALEPIMRCSTPNHKVNYEPPKYTAQSKPMPVFLLQPLHSLPQSAIATDLFLDSLSKLGVIC